MGIAHFDDVPRRDLKVGHLNATWSLLGQAAGSVGVGVRRLEIPTGGWSTPAHEHGREEEIVYVLSGHGVVWKSGTTAAIETGDCIMFHAGRGGHTLHATDRLDVLIFGPRLDDEAVGFPRLGMSLVGHRAVQSVDNVVKGMPIQFVREAEVGPPDLPAEPGPRPDTIVNLGAVEPETLERTRVTRTRRDLGRAAGSKATGLQHVEVAPGKESSAQHCHSLEEELFVVLAGDGALVLGDEDTPVRAGHVIARPPGTGVAHTFRAGDHGLNYLAYGTREPGDICFYPRSNKISFRGVKLIARLEALEYWDGEEP